MELGLVDVVEGSITGGGVDGVDVELGVVVVVGSVTGGVVATGGVELGVDTTIVEISLDNGVVWSVSGSGM